VDQEFWRVVQDIAILKDQNLEIVFACSLAHDILYHQSTHSNELLNLSCLNRRARTKNCECCEIYDTDGGKNYLVKGTVQGIMYFLGLCSISEDFCRINSATGEMILREYRIEDAFVAYEEYDCSQRTDGNIRCVDGHCGCLSDDDCKKFNPNSYCDDTTKTCKIGCKTDDDCLEYAKKNCNGYLAICENNQCICETRCWKTSQCLDNYCCRYDVDRTTQCVGNGTIINYEGKSYLCDPPHWNLENSKSEKSFLEKLLEKIKELIYPLFPILKK
jgi:hypothetical protein